MRRETKNTCRWPILLLITVPKIFVNGQFYFNLSSKMWSHVFFGTQCISLSSLSSLLKVLKFLYIFQSTLFMKQGNTDVTIFLLIFGVKTMHIVLLTLHHVDVLSTTLQNIN